MFKRNRFIYHAGINGLFYWATGCYYTVMALYLANVAHMNANEVAMITSATPLLSIFTQPLLGTLADRFRSPRKVAMASLAITLVMNFVFMFTRSFILLLISSGLILSIYNAVTPLTDRIGTAAPYPFGRIRIFGSIGYAISAQISGLIYDRIAPQAPFVMFIAAAVLCIICIYRVNDPVVDTSSKTEDDSFSVKDAYTSLFHNRPFMIFLFINVFFWAASMCNNNYLSLFITSLGGKASHVGTYQLFSTFFEVPCILTTDFFLRKFSYKKLLMFSTAMAALQYFWYSTLPSPSLVIAVFVFKGFAIFFTMAQVKLVLDIVDSRFVSTAYGLLYMAGKGIGTVIVQLIGGRLIGAFPTMHYYYLFLTGLAVAAFVITLFFNTGKKPQTA